LQRLNKNSAFKSLCPTCDSGVLIVNRDANYHIIRYDRCSLCGQAFYYEDDVIAGEDMRSPHPIGYQTFNGSWFHEPCWDGRGGLLTIVRTAWPRGKTCSKCGDEFYRPPIPDAYDLILNGGPLMDDGDG
jgi:hypothetical protein